MPAGIVTFVQLEAEQFERLRWPRAQTWSRRHAHDRLAGIGSGGSLVALRQPAEPADLLFAA